MGRRGYPPEFLHSALGVLGPIEFETRQPTTVA
jgi:hypothetical protein